jgi:hypothetical protein
MPSRGGRVPYAESRHDTTANARIATAFAVSRGKRCRTLELFYIFVFS